jgi:colanic acid/amylovoran biosynthesis glycosyltransferase
LIEGISLINDDVIVMGRKRGDLKAYTNLKVYSYNNYAELLINIFLCVLNNPVAFVKVLKLMVNQNQTKRLESIYYGLILIKLRVNVFHIQWVSSLKQFSFLRALNIKIVVSLRGRLINSLPLSDRKFNNELVHFLPTVDAVHGVSHDIIHRANNIVSIEHVPHKVIYTGLNLIDFKPNNNYLDWRERDGKFRLLIVGRMNWKKGIIYLLHALKLLKSNGFIFTLTTVGFEFDEETIYNIWDMDLNNVIIQVPKTTNSNLMDIYKNHDLMVLSSVEEGIANVVIEAMASGLLVCSSDFGGIKEVITDGHNGWLFRVRNYYDLFSKIVRIMNISEEKKSEVRTNALNTISLNHSQILMCEQMQNLYLEVLDSNG